MPYIKRHAVKRVKAAKDACNNELQKVIHSITLYFEERLGEREREEAEEQYHKAQLHQQQMREMQLQQEREHQQRQHQQPHEQHPAATHYPEASATVAELYAAIQELNKVHRDLDKPIRDPFEAEERGSTTLSRSNSIRTEAVSFSRSHSRQRELFVLSGVQTTYILTLPSASTSTSPLRKHVTLPPAKLPISHSSPVPIPGDTSPRSKPSAQSGPPSSWTGQQSIPASRRLSRTVHGHMVPPAPHSTQSSRSTSRSRSPMPFSTAQHTPSSEPIPRGESSSSPKNPSARTSRHLDSTDAPVDPFMSTLHDLIAVSTDIMEMSSSALTSRPGMGSDLVRKVQDVGRAWEENPDWHGRTWYVTVLLAVASLSRVVEWFEAERQFWNFEDRDDEEVEPLQFVLRPEYEGEKGDRDGTETVLRSPATAKFEDDNPLRLTRPEIVERRSRDERVPQKDLRGPSLGHPPEPQQPQLLLLKEERMEPSHVVAESKRAQDAEDLRLKADKAKTSNILMELNLDGEHFLYINRTWFDIIGLVAPPHKDLVVDF
jgi:serine/threonine-protein kinase RIM15